MASLLDDTELKELKETLSDMIDTFGKSCKLYYQPVMVRCDCPSTNGNISSNTWLHGGPIPFNDICGMCNGTKLKPQEITENIKLIIDVFPSENRLISDRAFRAGFEKPDFLIRVRGHLYDLPKLQRCIEVQIDLPSEPLIKGFYKVRSDLMDTGTVIQCSYFICLLQKVK